MINWDSPKINFVRGKIDMIKRIGLALVYTISIPIIGFLVSHWILSDVNSELEGTAKIEELCQLTKILSDPNLVPICKEVNEIVLLQDASIWSGGVAVGLILLYALLSIIAGKNRILNAAIFPILIPISMLIIAGLVLLQGGILTYAAWIGESYAIGRVHFFLIGGIGLGALVGAFSLIKGLFSIKSSIEQTVFAQSVTEKEQPKVWRFVRELASSLEATQPDNIIVGLEPTFYATAAKTKLVGSGDTLEGETLFLSLPLMRLFNLEELKAVIGHELGHFRGKDTVYTLKFAPVYAGLAKSIDSLSDEEGGLSSLAKIPAISMLSVMHELFSINERKISRDREFEADKAGVSVASIEDLATALGKVSIYSHLWSNIRDNNVDRLNKGKVTSNLSLVFEDSAKYDISHRGIDDVLGEILQTRVSHPTDTHPTIIERYNKIGYPEDSLTADKLIGVGGASAELFEDAPKIEEELSLTEHRFMVSLGLVTEPDDEADEDNDYFMRAIYSLASSMVGADGKIEQEEIQVAEGIGERLISDFDPVDFRAFVNNLDDIPDFRELVTTMKDALNDSGKKAIYDYLKEIAYADDELADEEKELLVFVRETWELEV